MEDRALRRQILTIAWPAALESMLLGVVEVVDTVMVSSLGLEAVAAVGVTVQFKRILLMFILALNVGATALVSRRIGEGHLKEANQCMHQFVLRCILLALVLYTAAFLLARSCMLLSGANADTLELAVIYFRILVVGQFFQSVSLTVNACLRAAGKTRVTLVTNLAANGINLLCNYLLIYGKCGFPKWGVAGAAVATSLGSLGALLISLYSVRRRAGGMLFLSRNKELWKLNAGLLAGVKPITHSALQEQFFLRLGLFVYSYLGTTLGTEEFAVYQFIMNFANFQGYTYEGFSVTATAMTGQSLGAGNVSRAETCVRITAKMAYWTAGVIAIILIVGRTWILCLFSREGFVLACGSYLLLLVGLGCIPCAGAATYAGVLRGAGDTQAVARQALWTTTFFRPLLAWLLCYPCGLGQSGIWWSFFATHLLRWILLRHRYYRGDWKSIQL